MCCLYSICCYLVPDLKRNSTNVFNYSIQITLKMMMMISACPNITLKYLIPDCSNLHHTSFFESKVKLPDTQT